MKFSQLDSKAERSWGLFLRLVAILAFIVVISLFLGHGVGAQQPTGNTPVINGQPKAGTCSNQVVTALNNNAAPTCTTITSAYVDSSVRTTAGGSTLTAADTLTGLPTGCTQFPCVVYHESNDITAAVADTAVYTVPAAGFYRATISVKCKVSGAGTMTPRIDTMVSGALNGFSNGTAITCNQNNMPTAGYAQIMLLMRQNDQFGKYMTWGTPSGTATLDVVVERLY